MTTALPATVSWHQLFDDPTKGQSQAVRYLRATAAGRLRLTVMCGVVVDVSAEDALTRAVRDIRDRIVLATGTARVAPLAFSTHCGEPALTVLAAITKQAGAVLALADDGSDNTDTAEQLLRDAQHAHLVVGSTFVDTRALQAAQS